MQGRRLSFGQVPRVDGVDDGPSVLPALILRGSSIMGFPGFRV